MPLGRISKHYEVELELEWCDQTNSFQGKHFWQYTYTPHTHTHTHHTTLTHTHTQIETFKIFDRSIMLTMFPNEQKKQKKTIYSTWWNLQKK